MKHLRITSRLILVLLSWAVMHVPAEVHGRNKKPINKLLYMYRFYYLPFSLEFDQGRTKNDILPFFPEQYPNPSRLLTAEELTQLDSEWSLLNQDWPKRSLLEAAKVHLDGTVRITQRIIAHRVPLNRSAFDKISISDRIQLKEAFKRQPQEVRSKFKQLQFIKSFLEPLDEERFNFFIVGASWCNSSRQYRILFETLAKSFPKSNLNLHSIVLEDPEEKVFESGILKELFPNTDAYSHNSIPRFLAIESIKGKRIVYEEGEALKQLYERFFKVHKGYLDKKTTLFGKPQRQPTSKKPAIDPYLSSVRK